MRSIIYIYLWVLQLTFISPWPALQAQDETKLTKYGSLLPKLKERFKQLKAEGLYPPSNELDGQRLMGKSDWEKAKQIKYDAPIYYYGHKTMDAWFRGRDFVNQHFLHLPVNTKSLQRIHQIVHRDEFYWGHEYRRAIHCQQMGGMGPEDLKKLLQQMAKPVLRNFYPQSVNFTGTHFPSLAGQLRTSPLDELWVYGQEEPELAWDEFKVYRGLPQYFRTVVRPGAPLKEGQKVKAKIYFRPHPDMKERLDKIFTEVSGVLLDTKKGLEDKVKAVTIMQQRLIRNHPFLDGNGRTTRLLADSLFLKLGLPPTHFPNENDLTMTEQELLEHTLSSMESYLDLIELGRPK